jgi:hypothetical protein
VALIVLALAAGLILWLVLRDDGATTGEDATAFSIEQLRDLADSVDHPVFWVGPKDGYTYELARNTKGAIFIRYLPAGVDVGADQPYLTVATYPFPGAFAALEKVAADRDVPKVAIARKGIAVPAKGYPQSVHVAYPQVDYQAEVFDPAPGSALKAVRSGELKFLGRLTGSAKNAPTAVPAAASRAELTALATSLGHPIYWAGPRTGYTYEVTQDASGKVFIRYLPPGLAVGASKPYLTVATYPFPGALRRAPGTGRARRRLDDPTVGRRPGDRRRELPQEHPPCVSGLGLPGGGLRTVRDRGPAGRRVRPGCRRRLGRRPREPRSAVASRVARRPRVAPRHAPRGWWDVRRRAARAGADRARARWRRTPREAAQRPRVHARASSARPRILGVAALELRERLRHRIEVTERQPADALVKRASLPPTREGAG